VRNQPKWFAQLEESSKRTKVSTSGAFLSSSNLDTPSSYESTSPTIDRPIGTKTTKRTTKEKAKTKSSNVVDLTTMEEFLKTKGKTLKDRACVKHECNRLRDKEMKF